MNKRGLFAVITVALAVITSGSASADTCQFEDMIDCWTLTCDGWVPDVGPNADPYSAALITQCTPLSYTHDLTDVVDFDAGQLVTEAWLELDFTNDLLDGYHYGKWVKWDNREWARVAWDGSAWVELGEIGSGQYELLLDIDWLNDNGELDVTIQVCNPLGTATAWLDHSRLYGEVSCVPVPGAVLLGMLGLGAAGMRLRKRS